MSVSAGMHVCVHTRARARVRARAWELKPQKLNLLETLWGMACRNEKGGDRSIEGPMR